MRRINWAAGAAIALGLAASLPACDLGDRPTPAPTPTATPTPAPGTNWQPVGSPPPSQIGALQFVNAQVAWAAGEGNYVVRSEDGGQTWAAPKAAPSVGIPTLASWSAVSFVDPRHGFVGGSYGLFKTEDGGETWANVAPFGHDNGPPPHTLNAIVRFRDYEHGVVIWLGEMHRTRDGGKTWTKAPLGPGQFRALGMIGGEFAVLTDANLWKSELDGSWGEVLLPTAFKEGMHNPAYGAFHFLDDKNGWVFEGGTLHRTTDGGQKWIAQVPDHRGGQGNVVRFIDAARGWVIGKGYFKATRTGGATWEEVPSLANFHQDRDRPRDIQILDAANVFVYSEAIGLRRWVAP